jgi:ABC-type amino acid transport substrate-binding protein
VVTGILKTVVLVENPVFQLVLSVNPAYAVLHHAASAAVACRRDGATWERIQETGVLRVGLDPTFPPFETADGVPLQGLDVDLAEAIAADLGLTVEFVYFGYDGLYDALATQQVDVLISALVITIERTRDFAYSDPYFNAGEILIVPADSPVREMADLANRSLAVELGAQGHVEATIWERRLTDLTILPYNTPDEAITAVAEQRSRRRSD